MKEHLIGGGLGKNGTGLLLNESQPYDPNTSISTRSRHRVALRNLQKIRATFKEPVYYLCLFASSITALSKDPYKTGFWTALQEWPDKDKIPSDFTVKALRVIEAYHEEMKTKDGGATSQQKRRRATPDTTEQLRLMDRSKRPRVGQSSPAESEGIDAVDHGQRLSVSPNSLPVSHEANKRLQQPEELRNSIRDAPSHTSSRRTSVSRSPEVHFIPRVVAYGRNKEDGNSDNDDNNGHNQDQENHNDHAANDNHEVDEVHQNDGYNDNQCDGAAKDSSLLTSHGTLLQNEAQLQMPHLHESQLDVSHASLQVPLQLHPQDQLQMSQEQLSFSHLQVTPGTTEYTDLESSTFNVPKFRGYYVPKEYLYEELAHYQGMVKLVFPLTPGFGPYFMVDVSETQARKYWAGRKQFM
ncbi:hypothetical protein CSAL01_09992 [Colletotrichum salicis]|uniref:Uncharacterized protein n=1 Tax=Colletotrichum salicis TaxID=1209931 RepID=A0A135T5Y3_9PEZI|nr:hypothetical protein CSAL01_09992 [Colletotrichum salicis]